MLTTRTGGFGIGVRQGWTPWQKNVEGWLTWCKAGGLGVVDVGGDLEACHAAAKAGMRIGSADLLLWKNLISADAGVRADAVAKNVEFVTAAAKAGAKNFFCVMLPEKPEVSRAENFKYMVEGFGALAPTLEKLGACVVIEGWPGPGALCCTPEAYRAFFKELPSASMAVNYDPSHLVRMGIDPIRFLGEFAGRVKHVHGKDAEILAENVYEFGTEIGATFAKAVGFGGLTWRYSIPGHGQVRWHKAFWMLQEAGYTGAVSIELEDAHFNGTEEGEKKGILLGARYLEGC
jgi:sugar phosphate isomerase/epimerase